MKEYQITLDLVKTISNEVFRAKTDDVDSIKVNFQLLNNDVPIDLTGATLEMVIFSPIKAIHIQPCTIDSATEGKFSRILDETCYSIAGEYKAEIRLMTGTEINITDKFYYESLEPILRA